MKAFILAAGLGTRLKPITDSKPKALVELNGVPLIEHLLLKLISHGFNSVIINVHHYADQVIEFIKSKKSFGIEIEFSNESGLLLDTGGGLKNVKWFFNNNQPFLIHNVDIFSNIDLNDLNSYHTDNNSIATLAVQKRNASRYFLFDKEKNLCGWVNEKTGETKITRKASGELYRFAFSGIQIVEPEIFDYMLTHDVFSLVDLYLSIASKHRITYFDHSNSIFVDLGKKENLIEAEKLIGK